MGVFGDIKEDAGIWSRAVYVNVEHAWDVVFEFHGRRYRRIRSQDLEGAIRHYDIQARVSLDHHASFTECQIFLY